jgi:hypothetical protein
MLHVSGPVSVIAGTALLLAGCATAAPEATPTERPTDAVATATATPVATDTPPPAGSPTAAPSPSPSPSPTVPTVQSFSNDISNLVYVGHQGQVLEPAPEEHPARISGIELERVDDEIIFCAVMPNMTGEEANWSVDLHLGEHVRASWRYQGVPPTIQTSAVNSERFDEIESATFPGDPSRPCVALPHEEAAGADRLAATSSVLPETYSSPEEGNMPGHRARDMLLVGIEPL